MGWGNLLDYMFSFLFTQHLQCCERINFHNSTSKREFKPCFANNFSKYFNLDNLGVSLPIFHSRTNLKLHISATPKIVKNIISNLDSSKASHSDFIPVVVLKNCEPKLSYILAELFNMSLKKSCFSNSWKVSLLISVFKHVGKGLQLKTMALSLLVFFLRSVQSLKDLQISDSWYGFGSSQ